MKGLKGLKEIHEIMEKIYEEEKTLTAEERLKRLKNEAERFMQERNLKFNKAHPKLRKHVGV